MGTGPGPGCGEGVGVVLGVQNGGMHGSVGRTNGGGGVVVVTGGGGGDREVGVVVVGVGVYVSAGGRCTRVRGTQV